MTQLDGAHFVFQTYETLFQTCIRWRLWKFKKEKRPDKNREKNWSIFYGQNFRHVSHEAEPTSRVTRWVSVTSAQSSFPCLKYFAELSLPIHGAQNLGELSPKRTMSSIRSCICAPFYHRVGSLEFLKSLFPVRPFSNNRTRVYVPRHSRPSLNRQP